MPPLTTGTSIILRRWSLLQLLYRLKLRKYVFKTRTSGVVFALLLSRTEKAEEVMNELLPIPNARAWKKWKTIILDRIGHREDIDMGATDWDDGTWTDREREFLVGLFQDARDAYEAFQKYLGESVFEHPLV
ncbi:hypothetical protein EDD15DRAFT_2155752 [Pisolithus albus]|nr:hypothetical protein EDD15DRAFT_2155752 [Pisolithus albus]